MKLKIKILFLKILAYDLDYDERNINKIAKQEEYTNFFGTYQNVSNLELFEGINENSPGIGNAIMQCKYGYSVVVFGYGYSGSGKSYTLINGVNNILSSALDKIYKEGGTAVIHKMSELYGWFNTNANEANGQLEYGDYIFDDYNNELISNNGNLTPDILIKEIENKE